MKTLIKLARSLLIWILEHILEYILNPYSEVIALFFIQIRSYLKEVGGKYFLYILIFFCCVRFLYLRRKNNNRKFISLKDGLGVFTNAFKYFNSAEHLNQCLFGAIRPKSDRFAIVSAPVYKFLSFIQQQRLNLYGYRFFISNEIKEPIRIDSNDMNIIEFYKQSNWDENYSTYNNVYTNLQIDFKELEKFIKILKDTKEMI